MELLISSYDAALIYYPNLFFLVLFLFGILGLYFCIKTVIFFKKILKNNVRKSQKTSIKRILVFKHKKDLYRKINKTFLRVKKLVKAIEEKITKFIERIKKEILIEE